MNGDRGEGATTTINYKRTRGGGGPIHSLCIHLAAPESGHNQSGYRVLIERV